MQLVPPRRRGLLRALVPGAVLTGALALAAGTPSHAHDSRSAGTDVRPAAQVPLYQDGAAQLADGGVVAVAAGTAADYLPGSRVLRPASTGDDAVGAAAGSGGQHLGTAAGSTLTAGQAAVALAASSQAWLDHGTRPGAGTRYADLGTDALLDVRALTTPDGAVLAGLSPHWRYVWPRDASFVSVALARTGHVEDALDVLAHLADLQEPDGSFEARYLPDGSGVPDDRGVQSDACGWVLWAAGEVVDAEPGVTRWAGISVRGLVTRCTEHVLDLVDTPDALPPASSDYWEVAAPELTLGTAAPLLAGLEAAVPLVDPWSGPTSDDVARAAARLRTAIEDAFGPAGYPRVVSGGPSDAATAFVLPPFQPTALAGADDAWRASVPAMLRAGGGLAPGGSWRDDGVSWTPQTALYALTAAATDDTTQAQHWLTWLDEHRTSSGAIPEKVLADGSPAAVAPLAWSAAVVVLALDELDRQAAEKAAVPVLGR